MKRWSIYVAAILAGLTGAFLFSRTRAETPLQPSSSSPAAAEGVVAPRQPQVRPAMPRKAREDDSLSYKDPTSTLYDPVRVLRVQGTTMRELFETEPRVPAFADVRETSLEDKSMATIAERYPSAEVSVQCKAATCSIDIAVASEQVYDVYMDLQRYQWGSLLSPTMVPGPEGENGTVTFWLTNDSELRDHRGFEEFFARHKRVRDALGEEYWTKWRERQDKRRDGP